MLKNAASSVIAALMFISGCARVQRQGMNPPSRIDMSQMDDPSGGNLFVDVGQGPLEAPSSAGLAACYRLYQGGQFSSGSGPMTDAQVINDLRNACHGNRDHVLVVVLVSSEEVQVSELVRAAKTIAKGCRSDRPMGGKNVDVRIYFEFPYDQPNGDWKAPGLSVEEVVPPH